MPPVLGPVDPGGEVLRPQFVALHFLATRLGVDGMQVEPMRAGDQAVGFVQVAAQLVGVAGLAGVVARCRQAPAKLSVGRLEAAHVVALPAV